ncbi:MAG: sugar phosphate isomerase/epimerase, partial [Acidobacteriota bacterium]
NRSNCDLGHFVAAGGDPIAYITKWHDKIASAHIKDRTTPANGAKNLAWGTGDTPLKQILETVSKNKWTFPLTIEQEYQIPDGSDAVKEVRKCVQYCKDALGA